MSRIAEAATILCVAALGVPPAHADVRGVVRFGVLPLDLESSRDTPLFGDDVDRAVTAYNAAAAYDRMNGGNTASIDASDLGVSDTLITFAPGLEAGGTLFVRLEGLLGIGDELRSLGLGFYPLNVQAPLGRDVTAYVSAGGSASWLDRRGSGDVGGLVSLRAAVGVRIVGRIAVEAGYGALVLGGVVDQDELEGYESLRDVPSIDPNDVVAAGEARGVIDLSVGVVF
jgi:hypothetical protein